jgi:hypothetical protein
MEERDGSWIRRRSLKVGPGGFVRDGLQHCWIRGVCI